MSQIYDSALAAAGVKVTQFSLLRAVERNEPAAITALADDLDLDRTTLTRNLSPLQRDRLVTLTTGEDQRVTEVRLTPKGRRAIADALPLWEKAQAEIAQRLGASRVETLREIAGAAIAVAASERLLTRQGRKR